VIEVSFDALAAESSRLQQVAETMTDKVDDARQRVEELTRSGWTGSAASAFGERFGQWAAAADDGIDALRLLVRELQESAQEYAATEQQAVSTSRELEGGLGSLGIADMMGGS
jgi:WXG100 family type VII secretion target